MSDAEVAWYLDHAVFLVSEDENGVIQTFVCANHQTGYVWALFVIDGQHRKGHGSTLLTAALGRLAAAGNRQSWLTTGVGAAAEAFYRAQGWAALGLAFSGETLFRKAI